MPASARAGLSRSLGKLLLLALSSLSAASPLPPFVSFHSSHRPEEPRTPLQLAVDIASIIALVLLGGVFAGLTLGLMGLDMVNLQVLSTSGSEAEKKHAGKVLKLLEKGRHWVLVVLLLGNVVVNESLPIFLSDFGGTAAVLVSTFLIVIFGEILPQSICARHGLAIGAYCAPLVHVTMLVMAPVAWPTAKLLDWCLGEDHGTTYRKAELKTFVSLHQQIGTDGLNEDEVTIIRAVLELNDKTVASVMTPIEDVYTMSADTIMNEENIQHLVQSGYSRVPVHEPGKPDAILGMLLVKRLITYDPEDAMPASWFQLTPLPETNPDLTLLDTLNYFQQGRSHMILVSKSPGEPKGAMGIVTLEDVIEEVIGEEIIDETDVFVDVHNKIKVVRNRPQQGTSANYAGLVQGIIERRRKSGMMKRSTPLKSYGALGTSLGAGGKAADKVAIKRPGSPISTTASQASYSTDAGTRGWGSPRQANGPGSGGVVLPGGSVIPSRRMSNEPTGEQNHSKGFTRTQTWSHPDASSNLHAANAPSGASDASSSSINTLVPPPPAPASVEASPRSAQATLADPASAAGAAALPLLDETIAEDAAAEDKAAAATPTATSTAGASGAAGKPKEPDAILNNARRVFGQGQSDERTALLGSQAEGKGKEGKGKGN